MNAIPWMGNMVWAKRKTAAAVLMAASLVVCDGRTAEDKRDYCGWADKAGRTLAAELPRRDLLEWSDELAPGIPTADGPTLCLAISVFQRAGQPERISKVIPRLKDLLKAERTDGAVIYWLCPSGHYEQVREWLDAFPQDIYSTGEWKAFLNWFEKKEGAKAIESWLCDKAAHERSTRSAIGGWYDYSRWSQLYWERLQANGKLQSHVATLAEKIRKEPTRTDAVVEYLGARSMLDDTAKKTMPIGWLADVVRIEHALDNWGLGRMLADEKEYEGAIRLFDKSLACPVADYDRQNFNRVSMCSMFVHPDGVEPILRQWTRGALAQACFQAGKLDRAQKLVEELTGKKDGTLADLGPFLFAGQVQAASGQRVVEARIKKAEEEQKGSVRYWLNRANYYIGRKEFEQAEQAYQSALKLPPDGHRFEVVRDYGWFLFNRERYGEADKLYRAEIARIGLNDPNGSNDFWFHQLERMDGKGGVRFSWDEPLIWQWLSEAKKRNFGQSEQFWLGWAAEKTTKTPEGWAAFEKKARALAADPCSPPLRYCLGTILQGHGQVQEGLRMVVEAYDQWPLNSYPNEIHVGKTVLGAYVGQSDWKNAEKILERLQNKPGFSGLEDSLGGIAVAAAKAGAPDDAMRLWRRKANLDLTKQDGLEALAAAGLAERLRDYYAGLAKRAPDNAAIAAALKKLEVK
ncbi:MAG: hypothetical protein KKE37_07325 [Verrucomicrobia bacterium]|nr:hypothetical protein [Verrucomicrobiota bacterium]